MSCPNCGRQIASTGDLEGHAPRCLLAVLVGVLLDRGHQLTGLDLEAVDADALWETYGGPAADWLIGQLDLVEPCEGCGDGVACEVGPNAGSHVRGLPGIRFSSDVGGDTSFDWIERCDTCRRFASDGEAAEAMVEAGLIEGFAWLAPHGSREVTPYALRAMSSGGSNRREPGSGSSVPTPRPPR